MKDAQQLHRFPYRWNEGIISVLKVLSFLLGQNLSSPHSVVWQPVHLHHICSSHFLTEVNIHVRNNSVNSELWTAFFLPKQQKSGTIFIYLFIYPHCPMEEHREWNKNQNCYLSEQILLTLQSRKIPETQR